MSGSLTWALAYAAVIAACVAVPAVGMRLLLPTITGSPLKTPNYRGHEVSAGLGIVWLWWVAGLVVVLMTIAVAEHASPGTGVMRRGAAGEVCMLLSVAAMVVVPAFVLGMIDDVYGGSDKGFRGHLVALRRARLTTGMLKLVGIGVAALVAAMTLSGDAHGWWELTYGTVLRTAVIALSANTVNLMDLRPGRALKVYGLLAVAVTLAAPFALSYAAPAAVAGAGLLGIALAGPLLAVWRYDVGEIAMLGDAGANPAGALVGVVMAAMWHPAVLAVVAVVLLALNVLSERVSFTRVIETNGALRRLDDMGRERGS